MAANNPRAWPVHLAPLSNDLQRQFVREYIVDFNATQAAARAGYSAKTAYERGSDLLKKPEIQKAVAAEIEARSDRTGITQDWVVQRLAELASADIADYMEWDDKSATFKPKEDLPPGATKSILSIKSSKNVDGSSRLEMKMTDKLKALEMLARHTGAFNDSVTVRGDINVGKFLELLAEYDPGLASDLMVLLRKELGEEGF
jgi:phage terminase small subunit